MKLKTLGGLALQGAHFSQPKPLLLLCYLALEGPKSRAHLAELFWPQGESRKSLSMALTRLRQADANLVAADEQRVWTTLDSDVTVLLQALSLSAWQRAEGLYSGAFLEAISLSDWSTELEEWVYSTREYVAQRVQHALLNVAEAAANSASNTAAHTQAFREAADSAERAYTLPGSGGADVATLTRMYRLLCAGDSVLAPAVRREAESYGVRLELSAAAARAHFKPHKTAALPLRNTSFVGRDVELTELATLLGKPGVSLVSLLGPAGVGKTRLALQLAFEQQKLGSFADGVYFLALDTLKDAGLLPLSLLRALGLPPQGETEPAAQLTDFIAERSLLLVLDNFEQLAGDARLLAQLLGACPNLKLLVTTRERLRLEEEHLFTLGGLPYPQADPLFDTRLDTRAELSDAVQLFGDRAQQLQPRFELAAQLSEVIRICALVEGLPLGLELAASWVRLMPCAEIAAEIERGLELLTAAATNVPERHRSVRAAFEASWTRLSPVERDTLSELAVFVGGFRREAAAAVTGATIPLLGALVDKSLLRVSPGGRYDRHPLLYQYTREKLLERPSAGAQAQAAHARYYLALAAHADAQLRGPEQVAWFGRLDEDLANFREALTYLKATSLKATSPKTAGLNTTFLNITAPAQEPAAALELATSLGYFWNVRGYYAEGFAQLTELLGRTSETNSVRARAYLCGADLAWKQGAHETAEPLYTQSLEVAQHVGDGALHAKALLGLGLLDVLNHGDFGAARTRYGAALTLAEACGDQACRADALRLLGALSSEQAAYADALSCYQTAEQLYGALGDQHSRAKALVNSATVLTYLGELAKAHALNEQALELFRTVGDRHGVGIALLNLGIDAVEAGRRRSGNAFYQESLELFRSLGDARMVSHLLNNLGGNLQRLGELAEAKQHLEESLNIQQRIGDVPLIAHALYILGQVYRDGGDLAKAEQTYAACTALCRSHDDTWTLMRVLEVTAQLHLQQRDFPAAQGALAEAHILAKRAGDAKTLAKLHETERALKNALSGEVERSGAPLEQT